MKLYETYTAEDFACDEDFLNWVKYPEGHPQLVSFWHRWLDEHPQCHDVVEEARLLVLAVLADDQYFPDTSRKKAVWARIQQTTHQAFRQAPGLDQGRATSSVPLYRRWYSRAAVLAFVVCIGWVGWRNDNPNLVLASKPDDDAQLSRHVNNGAVSQTVVLSDGTSVVLRPESILEYPGVFAADIREVVLTGEAFFEVKRDPERPFLVKSGEIITRVLGTSFNVRNMQGESSVVVQVKTGKVSVFIAGDRAPSDSGNAEKNVDGVVLMPNQQAVYERTAMKMTKSLVENPTVVIPPSRRNFEFADAPISEVFHALEEAYGVDIVYDEEVMTSCYLNASLDDVPLYDKLKLICKGINATYEIMDSHIIIYGKGCSVDNTIENPNP